MTNFAIGRAAESAAAEYLQKQGWDILAQNWRRRRCEIDIVAQKRKVVYFVEVKYRRGSEQGSGLEYITPAKLKQMRFAAAMWVAENNWPGDYQLAAVEVAADDFTVSEFIESLT